MCVWGGEGVRLSTERLRYVVCFEQLVYKIRVVVVLIGLYRKASLILETALDYASA